MADGALQHSLQVLRTHELDSLKTWEQAALVVRRAAESGADLSSALEVLRQAFLESHQLPIMNPLADALTCHYLSRGDEAGLRVLLADEEFKPYVLDSLGRYARGGREVSLELLLAAFPSARLLPLLIQRCQDHPAQIREVLERLRADPHLCSGLSALVRDLVVAGQVEVAVGADLVAGLLSEPAHRDMASSTLVWMAHAGLELSAAMPALWRGLEHEEPQVRRRCAQVLAYRDWQKTRSLLASSDVAVREGATLALGLLVAQGSRETELLQRLVTALVDSEESVRQLARQALEGHQAAAAPVALLNRLDDPAVVDYAYWWMHRSPERASQLLEWLEGRPGGEALRRTCEEVARGDHEWACSLCKFIPRSLTVSSASDVPRNVARLEPGGEVESSRPRTCPECGSRYQVSYSEEYDDMSLEVTIQVERRVEPRAERLSHIEGYMRTDAAYALGRERAPELFVHPDPLVREAALEAFGEVNEALVAGLSALLHDPVAAVRGRAAWRLVPYCVEKRAVEPLRAALDEAPEDVGNIVLAALRNSELHPSSFAEIVRRRARSGPCRERAISAVAWLARRGFEVPAQIELLEGLLLDPDKNCRKQALSGLGELLEHWPQMPARMVSLLADPELHYYSLPLLRRAARLDQDLSACYPALIRVMLENPQGYSDKAGWALQEALQHRTPRSAELVSALAPGWQLQEESARQAVGGCFEILAQADLDLSPAREAILRALTGPRTTYIESNFASEYAAWLVRRGDTETLEELLIAGPEISGAASRVLTSEVVPPLLPTLVGLLGDRHWYARDGAVEALRSYAGAGHREEVLGALEQAPPGEGAGKLREALK